MVFPEFKMKSPNLTALRIFFSHRSLSFFSNLSVNPPHNQRHNKMHLIITERPALSDPMPF
jgi:hypothetical protein